MNKKIVLLIVWCLIKSPLLQSSGPQSFTTRLRGKKITNFEQALAQLYAQKPELLQPQASEEVAKPMINTTWKTFLDHSTNALPLLYFCYGSFYNYTNYVKTNHAFHESSVHKMVLSKFPGLLVNTPSYVGLFLQEVELIVQAYLFKILLKMIIFCFG